jgi:hypothetical protein
MAAHHNHMNTSQSRLFHLDHLLHFHNFGSFHSIQMEYFFVR